MLVSYDVSLNTGKRKKNNEGGGTECVGDVSAATTVATSQPPLPPTPPPPPPPPPHEPKLVSPLKRGPGRPPRMTEPYVPPKRPAGSPEVFDLESQHLDAVRRPCNTASSDDDSDTSSDESSSCEGYSASSFEIIDRKCLIAYSTTSETHAGGDGEVVTAFSIHAGSKDGTLYRAFHAEKDAGTTHSIRNVFLVVCPIVPFNYVRLHCL